MKLCATCHRCCEDRQTACAWPGHLPLVPTCVETRVIDGKYRLDRLIARGGIGDVYAATDLGSDRLVAVKLLAPSAAPRALALEHLRLEVLAVAQIDHPSVVAPFDFGLSPQGQGYLVMELLEGRTLRQHLHDHGPLPLIEALSMLRQVALAIEAAHFAGVVHRDLTPSNIILMPAAEGRLLCKVIDFGQQRRGGRMRGTPRYLSPEQLARQEGDARSDIYALGLILREVLTEEGVSRAPLRLQRLIGKALQLDPDDRFQTVAELIDQIVLLEYEIDATQPKHAAHATSTPQFDSGADTTVELCDSTSFDRTVELESRSVFQRLRWPAMAAALMSLVIAASWLIGDRTEPAPPVATVSIPKPALQTPPIEDAQPIDSSAVALDAEAAAREALVRALESWLASTNARDFEGQLHFYPSSMERFYLWRNVPRDAVMAEKRRVFAQADIVDVRAGAPRISIDPDGRRASMLFQKQYLIKGKRIHRHGEVLQELRWEKNASEWKIVSERDLRVIS